MPFDYLTKKNDRREALRRVVCIKDGKVLSPVFEGFLGTRGRRPLNDSGVFLLRPSMERDI